MSLIDSVTQLGATQYSSQPLISKFMGNFASAASSTFGGSKVNLLSTDLLGHYICVCHFSETEQAVR